MIKAVMFDTKPYDIESFDKVIGDDIEINYYETKLDRRTAELARGCDVVITFVNDVLDGEVIARLATLDVKLIALRCAGFNNVDFKAAYGKIHIVRVPAYSPHAVAEHTMAMLLTSLRRIHKAYNRTRDFNFSIAGFTGFDLYGRTVGVIGAGKIGRAFIDICNGFGMRVLAYDKYPGEGVNAEFVELDKLISESDIISLHCPLTEENYHIIDGDSISRMKDGVYILNTSRGALIDAESLLEGIKSKKIGAACLDVYEEESDVFFDDRSGHILQDDTLARLLSMPNVLVTSHQAFLTEEALAGIAETTVANIRAFFGGEKLVNEICYHCSDGDVGECKKQRGGRCF
ncbi:MAG: 2-hydroxyacid dehydrogenase [Clostridiales bacterium]|nr:2-hydroxyacid dehydrogenase [Clostridiales bacterium]